MTSVPQESKEEMDELKSETKPLLQKQDPKPPLRGWKRFTCLCCVAFCSCIFVLLIIVFVLAFFLLPIEEPIRVTPIEEAIDVPDAPEPVQLVEQGITKITITWNEPNYHKSVITDYEVQFSPDTTSNFTTHFPGPGVSRVYTVDGLDPSLSYFFRVRAINEVGPGNYSNPSGYQTLNATEPNPPSPVLIMATTGSSLSLDWMEGETNGATITGYELELQNSEQNEIVMDWQVVCTGINRGCVVKNLKEGTYYQFRVRTLSVQGPSNWSDTSQYHTDFEGSSRPNPPTLVQLTSNSCSSLLVQCQRPNDNGAEIISYLVEVANKTESFLRSPIGTMDSVQITGLSSSYNYSVSIKSLNTIGISESSDEFYQVTLDPSPPQKPQPPIVIAATATIITLNWKEPNNNCAPITGYILESDNWWFDEPFQPIYEGESLNFTHDDLLPATKYNFRVKAVNAAGESVYSEVTQMKTFDKGSCGNEADVLVVKENFDTMQGIIQGCLIRCAIGGTDCALNCIMNDLGLSESCAFCWVDMGLCTLNRCTTECLRPSSAACFTCTERECFPETVICTGMPQWSFPT